MPNSKDIMETMGELNETQAQITTNKIPSGYIEVKLSSNGRLGAPKVFHIRNFDLVDLMDLALSEQEDLPLEVIDFLDELIFEDNVSIKDFHEKEVHETLIILFRSFFSQFIRDLPYELTDQDWKWAEAKFKGKDTEEYMAFKRSIDNKEFKPKIDIDIDSLSFQKLPDDFVAEKEIEDYHGMSAKFSFPRYGDIMIIKKHIDNIYKEKDKQFAKLLKILELRRDAEDRLRRGENIAYHSIPDITDFDKQQLKEYQKEKSKFSALAIKALHLVELDGQDVTTLPLGDRIKLVDAEKRLDFTLYNAVSEQFEKLKNQVGIDESKVPFKNPITLQNTTGRFSFRVFDLIQAAQLQKPDAAVIKFK